MEMNIIQVYYPIVYLYEHTGNHVASLSTAYKENERSCPGKQNIVILFLFFLINLKII